MSTQPHGGTVPEFTVGDRLRKAREVSQMDQGELADAMGVSRRTISNNESGNVKPRVIVIRAWALATGVSAAWLETGVSAPDGGGEGGPSPTFEYVINGPHGGSHLRSVAA